MSLGLNLSLRTAISRKSLRVFPHIQPAQTLVGRPMAGSCLWRSYAVHLQRSHPAVPLLAQISFGHDRFVKPHRHDIEVLRRLQRSGRRLHLLNFVRALVEPMPLASVLLALVSGAQYATDLAFLFFVAAHDTRPKLFYGVIAWGLSTVARAVLLWRTGKPSLLSVAVQVCVACPCLDHSGDFGPSGHRWRLRYWFFG